MIAYMRYSPNVTMKIKRRLDPEASSDSIATQRQQIESWIEIRKLPPVTEWFIDEETSARKTPLHKRDAGARMLEAISQGQREVVVARLDRIFRSVIDGNVTLEEWRKMGVILHTANGVALDVGTASGWLCVNALLMNAQFEPQMLSERVSSAMRSKQARGRKVSSRIPYGFVEIGDGQIGEQASEQAAIQTILEWARRGLGPGTIARLADESELPCRGSRWHHSTVSRILKNGISGSGRRHSEAVN